MTATELHALTNLLTGLKIVRSTAARQLDDLMRTLAVGDELIARGEAALGAITAEDGNAS